MTLTSLPVTRQSVGGLPRQRPEWVQVVTHLDPSYGGLSTAVPEIGASVARTARFRTCIAGFCGSQEHCNLSTSAEMHVAQFPLAPRFRPSSDPGGLLAFQKLVGQSAGLHIHGLWEGSTALAARVARVARKPYILSAHGMLERWALRNKWLKKRIYLALAERANLQGAACLHALTESEGEDYRRLGLTNPIAVIPNGVRVPQDISPSHFLEAFPQLRGKRLLLFLGRIHFKKGLDILIETWAHLALRFPDVQLVVAGPDFEGTRARVERQIASAHLDRRVSFTGMLAGDLKWSALAASELFVLPSYSEGLSVSVLEAMGLGLPVVITTNCHLPEVAVHRCGWLIDANSRALETALGEALELTPDALSAFGSRGRQLVRRSYNWPAVGSQFAALYEWVAGGERPAGVTLLRAGEAL